MTIKHLTTTTSHFLIRSICSIEGGTAEPAGGAAPPAAPAAADPVAAAPAAAPAVDEPTLMGGPAAAKPADPAPAAGQEKTGALARTPEEIAAAQATEDATKAAAEAVEVPEGTPFDLKAPEGFAGLDKDALDAAQPLLRGLGIKTNAAAQAAINSFSKEVLPGMVQRAIVADRSALVEGFAAQKAAWAAEAKADPEIGGSAERLQTNLDTAIKFRDRFGGEEVTKILNEFGLGNHPAFIRMFVKAGKAFGEGAFFVSDATSQVKGSAETRLYGAEFQPK